jgi:hypothetical protein
MTKHKNNKPPTLLDNLTDLINASNKEAVSRLQRVIEKEIAKTGNKLKSSIKEMQKAQATANKKEL